MPLISEIATKKYFSFERIVSWFRFLLYSISNISKFELQTTIDYYYFFFVVVLVLCSSN